MKYKTYPNYSESGIGWIGLIPSEWETKRLKYICSVNNESLPETTYPDYQMRYVDIGSVTYDKGIEEYQELLFENSPSRARRIVRKGDVIISTVRTYLKAIASIYEDEDVIVSTGFAVIRPLKVWNNYLNYLVRTPYFVEMVSANSLGVSYPAINPPKMMNIEVPLPPIDEQIIISNFIDNKVGLLKKSINEKTELINKLKEKRSSVIHSATTRGLNTEIKMKSIGVEWIKEIPENWEIKKLKYVVSTKITDGPHTTPQLVVDGIPFVSAESVKGNRIDLNFKRGYISEDDHKEFCKKCKPMINDIFIIKSGATTGAIAYVDIDEEFSVWSPLALIRSKKNRYHQRYIYYAMLSDYFKKQVEISWSFGTQQNIGMGVIENLKIFTPPLEEQILIVNYLDWQTKNIDMLIENTQSSIDKLNEYMSSLLTAVVFGKIDVRGE